MENSYIKDYMVNFLENTFNNDFERLKAVYYGVEDIIENIQYNLETNEDKKTYNVLCTISMNLKEIIERNKEKIMNKEEFKNFIETYSNNFNKGKKMRITHYKYYGTFFDLYIEDLENGEENTIEIELEDLCEFKTNESKCNFIDNQIAIYYEY